MIQGMITSNMSNTAQQFLELQAMLVGAPEKECNRYFALLCQKAIIDAEIKLSQSQFKRMQHINTTTTTVAMDSNKHSDNDDDSNSSGLEGVPPFQV